MALNVDKAKPNHGDTVKLTYDVVPDDVIVVHGQTDTSSGPLPAVVQVAVSPVYRQPVATDAAGNVLPGVKVAPTSDPRVWTALIP